MVGDPKMAPFIDTVHDVNIIDARILGDANLNEPMVVQVLIENRGMGASNGTLSVRTVLGNTVLNAPTHLPTARDVQGVERF